MDLISCKEAMRQGLKRYFTGKECYRGHISERLVSNRGCLQCHADDQFCRQVGNRTRAHEIDKKSRENRPWKSLRHLKENHSVDEWNAKLQYMRIKNHERRAYSIGTLSLNIVELLLEKQAGICNGCSEVLTDYHVDHIEPLSRMGTNTDDNVQLLCPTCNLSKGSKTMKEWKGL